MFRLSLKTNASLVCLFLLSSAPLALSCDSSDDDNHSQEITNNSPARLEEENVVLAEDAALVTAVFSQQHLLKRIFDALDLTNLTAFLSINKDLTQMKDLKTYHTEGFPLRLQALFPSLCTSSDDLLSFCENNIIVIFPLLRKLPESSDADYFQKFRALFSKKDDQTEDYDTLLKHCSHYRYFINSYGRDKVIEELQKVADPKIRNWLLEQAPALFTEDMSGSEKAQIIKVLGKIADSNIRDWVMEKASALFMEGRTISGRSYIIKALWKIADSDIRQELLEQAHQLFTEQMSNYEKSEIIKALGNITNPKMLKLIMEQASKLFMDTMNGYDKADIIKKEHAATVFMHSEVLLDAYK